MRLSILLVLLSISTSATAQEIQIPEEHREYFQRSLFTLSFASGCSQSQNNPQLLKDATELLTRTLRNADIQHPEGAAEKLSAAASSRTETPQSSGVNVFNDKTCTALAETIAKRMAE